MSKLNVSAGATLGSGIGARASITGDIFDAARKSKDSIFSGAVEAESLRKLKDNFNELFKNTKKVNEQLEKFAKNLGYINGGGGRGGAGGGGGVPTGGGGDITSGFIKGNIIFDLIQRALGMTIGAFVNRFNASIKNWAISSAASMEPTWQASAKAPIDRGNFGSRLGGMAEYGETTRRNMPSIVSPVGSIIRAGASLGYGADDMRAYSMELARQQINRYTGMTQLSSAFSAGTSPEVFTMMGGAARGAGMSSSDTSKFLQSTALMGRSDVFGGMGGDRPAVLLEKIAEILKGMSDTGEKNLEGMTKFMFFLTQKGFTAEEASRLAQTTGNVTTAGLNVSKMGAWSILAPKMGLDAPLAIAAAGISEDDAQKKYGNIPGLMEKRKQVLQNASKLLNREATSSDMTEAQYEAQRRWAKGTFGEGGSAIAYQTAATTGLPRLSAPEFMQWWTGGGTPQETSDDISQMAKENSQIATNTARTNEILTSILESQLVASGETPAAVKRKIEEMKTMWSESIVGKSTDTVSDPSITGLDSESAIFKKLYGEKGTGKILSGHRWGASRDGGARRHKGTDFTAPTGTPVYAIEGGTIGRVGTGSGKSGSRVEVVTPDGLTYSYMHTGEDFSVRQGQIIKAGQQIATVGRQKHIHLQTSKDGEYTDPLETVSGRIKRSSKIDISNPQITLDLLKEMQSIGQSLKNIEKKTETANTTRTEQVVIQKNNIGTVNQGLATPDNSGE